MDEKWMREALLEAKKGFACGEVPVGAVIVLQNTLIARAHNQVETVRCATAHAELLAIEEASKKYNDWRLADAYLYTTLEPCAMCLGGILLSRIKKVIYGADDIRHGACGSWVNLLEAKHPTHTLEIKRHVLQNESAELLKSFFQKRRKEHVCNT